MFGLFWTKRYLTLTVYTTYNVYFRGVQWSCRMISYGVYVCPPPPPPPPPHPPPPPPPTPPPPTPPPTTPPPPHPPPTPTPTHTHKIRGWFSANLFSPNSFLRPPRNLNTKKFDVLYKHIYVNDASDMLEAHFAFNCFWTNLTVLYFSALGSWYWYRL